MNNLTPEQEQKSRDEFEAHYKTYGCRFDKLRDGNYQAEAVQCMWAAWRDRHRTICVELPSEVFYSWVLTDAYRFAIDEFKKVLQAAGIGVKS